MPDEVDITTENTTEIEYIPDKDLLYYHIHKFDVDSEGKPRPGAFRERSEGEKRGMSTDWCKYITPDESRKKTKEPDNNGILRFIVINVRQIPYQEVLHAPEDDNRAHTNIKWNIDIKDKTQKEEIRKKYMKIYKWEIKI